MIDGRAVDKPVDRAQRGRLRAFYEWLKPATPPPYLPSSPAGAPDRVNPPTRVGHYAIERNPRDVSTSRACDLAKWDCGRGDPRGICDVSRAVTITARSMTSCRSRTLRGHACRLSLSMTTSGTSSTDRDNNMSPRLS
jgi:hypothetical protein